MSEKFQPTNRAATKVRIAVVLEQERDGYTFEISSADSGRNSGIIALKNKLLVTVPLHNRGSRFKSGGTVVASNVAKILTYCPRRNV